MGFLKKVLGTESADETAARADTCFNAGQFGEAKLLFEKAAARADSQDMRLDFQRRVIDCLNGIARQRFVEAQRLFESGQADLAAQELAGALEVAEDDDLRADIQGLFDREQAREAQADALVVAPSREELLVLLTGSWDEDRADEYAALGENYIDALVDVHLHGTQKADAALPESTLSVLRDGATSDEACYAWLELGRAEVIAKHFDAARDALSTFVKKDAPRDLLLAAYFELAGLERRAKNEEAALDWYQLALEEAPEDYRPYLALGNALRLDGDAEGAVEILSAGKDFLPEINPDWQLEQELGLALADTGRDEDAIAMLENVVGLFTFHRQLDFPVPTATRLAELHERAGNLERAADLYATLSEGHDGARHAFYYYHTARLMKALGSENEYERLLTRARAVLKKHPDAEVARLIATLAAAGSPPDNLGPPGSSGDALDAGAGSPPDNSGPPGSTGDALDARTGQQKTHDRAIGRDKHVPDAGKRGTADHATAVALGGSVPLRRATDSTTDSTTDAATGSDSDPTRARG